MRTWAIDSPKRVFQQTVQFVECWCGLPIALTTSLLRWYDENGYTVYCAHGHRCSLTETENNKLRKELKAAQAKTTEAETAKVNAERTRDAALKEKQRQLKRVSNGVCPHCRRSFVNLQRHMVGQHNNDKS